MDRREFIKFVAAALASLGLPVKVVSNEPLPEYTVAPPVKHEPLTIESWKAAAGAFKKTPPPRGYWPMPECIRPGHVFYVDERTGNDANDGLSPERPLLTKDHAISLCTAGPPIAYPVVFDGNGEAMELFDSIRQSLERERK